MNAWRTVCVALAALPIGNARAEERKSIETKPAVAAKEVFHVYGNLRRCFRPLLGTYESVDEACRAAEKFRNDKTERTVEVALNTGGTFNLGAQPIEYRVYRNPCKGFSLANTVASFEKANEIAEAGKKNGDRVEIVSVFAKK